MVLQTDNREPEISLKLKCCDDLSMDVLAHIFGLTENTTFGLVDLALAPILTSLKLLFFQSAASLELLHVGLCVSLLWGIKAPFTDNVWDFVIFGQ